jgi:glycosyltransferase involved in cell wall biosynthesis
MHGSRADSFRHQTGSRSNNLTVSLDAPLPGEVAVGAGTALFVCGWCFDAEEPIRSLSLVVDGDAQPVTAHGMPRLDVFRALHPNVDPFATAGMAQDLSSSEDPFLRSYRSGFWGIAHVPARDGNGVCEIELRARLEGGGESVAELARIPTRMPDPPAAAPPPAPRAGPLVAVCMATYDPPLDLLERQLESIRAQTHENWLCLISDDCSRPDVFEQIRQAVGDDSRFVLSRSPRRLGFYHNFERALSMAPADARYVAVADQDDFWHPDKLETLLSELGDAQLIYSDARIVDREGDVISGTYWTRRRNNHASFLSLLVANAVTGAASLFRRDVLEHALPFPPAQFAHFHDHWIGLTALALGDIAYTDRALYDYVQHDRALLGHAAANHMTALRARFGSARRDMRDRVAMWRMHYFVDVCRLAQYATILRMRCGSRMDPAKRRALDRFLRTERSLIGLADLARRGVRELVGPPETLGAEWMLFHAFAWRRLLNATVRERPLRRLRLDAVPPPALDPLPGRRVPAAAGPRAVADKIAPLTLAERDDAPPRVNLLIPTIDLEHFFGGYIAKLNLARRLAERGERVRIVTVDPVGPLPRSWRRQLESYDGLAGLFDRVEVAFGRESAGLEVSRGDRFVATTWWTAHIAHEALSELGAERFLYLIQEYEPFTFPMGSFAALAAESYTLPHVALFSSELLRDYFRRHGLGVYRAGPDAGDLASTSFQNAITPVPPPSASELASRRERRLLFYARPEPHAARNMFELGVLALGRALDDGAFGSDWGLYGIGSLDAGQRIDLGRGGKQLHVLPRFDQSAYAAVLREHDVGLALMYTPHPSLVPIEMASAGMLTVTNTFENKTAEAMAEISSNVVAVDPSVEGVAAGLCRAAAGTEDFERRARGAAVRWSRDWNDSFDEQLLDRIVSFLRA